MEYMAKRFTLIDFLGIFSPGAVLVLAVNYYAFDLRVPYDRFFTENMITLSAYFLAISYLCGSALHQLGAMAERYFKEEKNVYSNCLYQKEIKAAYQKKFHMKFPNDEKGQINAGRQIFSYVQRIRRPERIVLFSAFYTMSRTLIVTLFIMLLMTAAYRWNVFWSELPLLCIYLAGIWIFCMQRERFSNKCIEEAYMLFAFEEPERQDQAAET